VVANPVFVYVVSRAGRQVDLFELVKVTNTLRLKP